MKEFEIIRKMNELADKIDSLCEARARLKSSEKVDVLSSVVVSKHESITINFKNNSLVKIIELEIDELERSYNEFKTQLLNR